MNRQRGAISIMSDSIIAQKAPYEAELEAGKKYAWCRCGRSAKQPFCDGAHSETDIKPLIFTAEKSGTNWMCGCKQTAGQPFCDGTHGKL
jgi:CDGSH-type Zn-finger protein